jgi:peptide/nickel transport system permease protein
LSRSIAAWIGIALVGLFLLVAALGPLAAPYHPDAQNLRDLLRGPGRGHWLGTDENGCDLLSQILYGARLAAAISGATVASCLVVGTAVGTLAGYAGGAVDDLLMRVVDVLLAFPGILLNLTVAALMPRTSAAHLVFILSLNGWVGYARVARGQALALREREFVQAARAVGASPLRVGWRHIIPNLASPLIIQASFGFAGIILVESSLSFLGLGPQHAYSWGALLNQGTTYLWRATYLAAAPGIAIAAVVLGFNLVGDALRDWLDPRRVAGRSSG